MDADRFKTTRRHLMFHALIFPILYFTHFLPYFLFMHRNVNLSGSEWVNATMILNKSSSPPPEVFSNITITKYERKNTKKDSQLVHLPDNFAEFFHKKSNNINFRYFLSQSSIFFIAHNVLVNGCGAIIHNDTLYDYPDLMYAHMLTNGTIEGSVKEAVQFGNYYIHMYAHVIVDYLVPFFLMPKEIKERVPLIVIKHVNLIKQIIDLIGGNSSNVIYLNDKNNYLFVETLYTVHGNKGTNSHYGYPLRNFSDYLRKKLNLSSEEPKRFVFKNRNRKETRFIFNFLDLFKIVNSTYPKYPWEIDYETNYDLYYVSKFFNSIKFLITPTGSSVTNALYMQPQSVVLMVFATWPDYYAILSCVSNDVHAVVCLDGGIGHYSRKKWNVKKDLFMESINVSLSVIEQQKSPSK